MINSSFTLHREQLRLGNIKVELNLCPSSPYVYGSAMRLEQVVSNLISNGRDAILSTTSKRGGIIRVSTNIKNNFVSLYVSDSGPGIKKGDIERIFDPFYTTKDAGQGTGLGLSIAYSIIKEHSGEINYLTLPNMGATFCITLPQLKS